MFACRQLYWYGLNEQVFAYPEGISCMADHTLTDRQRAILEFISSSHTLLSKTKLTNATHNREIEETSEQENEQASKQASKQAN